MSNGPFKFDKAIHLRDYNVTPCNIYTTQMTIIFLSDKFVCACVRTFIRVDLFSLCSLFRYICSMFIFDGSVFVYLIYVIFHNSCSRFSEICDVSTFHRIRYSETTTTADQSLFHFECIPVNSTFTNMM